MRTNIDIPDDLMDAAMKAGSFKTKKEAVEAGLRLIARQAVYRDLLALQGKLHWDGDAETWIDTPAESTPAPVPGATSVAGVVVSSRAKP